MCGRPLCTKQKHQFPIVSMVLIMSISVYNIIRVDCPSIVFSLETLFLQHFHMEHICYIIIGKCSNLRHCFLFPPHS